MILLSSWPTSRPARWIAGPATRSCPSSKTFTATVVPSSWLLMPLKSPTARNDGSPYTMDGSLKMMLHRLRVSRHGPRIPYHDPPGKPANRRASLAGEQAPKRSDGAWDRGRSCRSSLHGFGGSGRPSRSFREDPHAWSQPPDGNTWRAEFRRSETRIRDAGHAD